MITIKSTLILECQFLCWIFIVLFDRYFSYANVQAIALSLAESSETSVTAIGAETSSTVKEASEGTPYKNNGKTSIQDSAKNRKIRMLVHPFQLDIY